MQGLLEAAFYSVKARALPRRACVVRVRVHALVGFSFEQKVSTSSVCVEIPRDVPLMGFNRFKGICQRKERTAVASLI